MKYTCRNTEALIMSEPNVAVLTVTVTEISAAQEEVLLFFKNCSLVFKERSVTTLCRHGYDYDRILHHETTEINTMF